MLKFFRSFSALAYSLTVSLPFFFYFPSFRFYVENVYVRRESGALLPICFVPLGLLLLLKLPTLYRGILTNDKLLPFASIILLFLFSVAKGVSPLFSLQTVVGLVALLVIPYLSSDFKSIHLWLALTSTLIFSLLHIIGSGILVNLSDALKFENYGSFYGYVIYHAYVSFSEVLFIMFSLGILAFTNSNRTSLHLYSSNISIVILLYAFTFTRVSTMVAFFFGALAVLLFYIIRLIKSLKLTSPKSLILSLSLSIVPFLLANSLIIRLSSRLVNRIFTESGSSRTKIWFDVFSKFTSPLDLLFGAGDVPYGAHNLPIELFYRVGLVGLILFIFPLFSSLLFLYKLIQARSETITIFPSLAFFIACTFVGNFFNESLTQPFNISSVVFYVCIMLSFKTLNIKSQVAQRACT